MKNPITKYQDRDLLDRANRPKVASVTIVVKTITEDETGVSKIFTQIKFNDVEDVTYVEWLSFESIVFNLNNTILPPASYVLLDIFVPNFDVSLPTFVPSKNPTIFSYIEYRAQGIVQEFNNLPPIGTLQIQLKKLNINTPITLDNIPYSYEHQPLTTNEG